MPNQVTCLHCYVTITSTHRHDFKACGCKDPELQIMVDGGDAYDRRVFGKKAKWVESDGTKTSYEEIMNRTDRR